MALFIYHQADWPRFFWDENLISPLLAEVRFQQGKLLGRMENLGFNLQSEASLETITQDIIESSEIEGEHLDIRQVRSSIARRLGIDVAGAVVASRHVEGIVELMLDATQNFHLPLTAERLFDWHAALFPTGRSGMHKIVTGAWRNNPPDDPMQIVSGPMGRETIHFQAPDSGVLENEMTRFINWFETSYNTDPIVKAAIAHLWFEVLHPFEDGNGRIGRAVMDMQLARADNRPQRFYSLSAQMQKEQKAYYAMLEKTSQGTLDITDWIMWFLNCVSRAIGATNNTLQMVLRKASFWDKYKATVLNSRQRLMLNKVLDGFTGKMTSSKWAKIAKCSTDTAIRDINDLMGKDILEKEPAGGRSTSYVLKD